MIDIEKLKAKQAEELREAEYANAFELRTNLNGNFHFGSAYGKDHGTKFAVSYGFGCNGGHYFDNDKEYPTIQDAARILNMFPSTRDWTVSDKKWSGPYRLYTGRGFNDNYGYLEIQWIHDEVDITFYLRIEAYDKLKELFDIVGRRIDDSELSTWHPVKHNGQLDCDRMIPRYRFKGVSNDKQTYYQGGGVALLDNDKAAEIVELIKSQL